MIMRRTHLISKTGQVVSRLLSDICWLHIQWSTFVAISGNIEQIIYVIIVIYEKTPSQIFLQILLYY